MSGAFEQKFHSCNFSFQGLVLPILCLIVTQIYADSDIDTGNREKKLCKSNFKNMINTLL